MPFAVSATTFSGLRLSRWTNERTWAANSSSMSRCSTTDVVREVRDPTVRGRIGESLACNTVHFKKA